MNRHRVSLLVVLAFLAWTISARAQWKTQTLDLKPGWNAVYLHVNAEHQTIDSLVGADPNNPIVEIWRWNPALTAQFIDSPVVPTQDAEWTSWVRIQQVNGLQRLAGNTAYLVRVGSNVTSYAWTLKGKPVVPAYEWTVTGVNFIGFPTVPLNPPKFDAFLAPAPELQTLTPEIYYYLGGELSSNNPSRLFPNLFRFTPVKRGQAFWIRTGEIYNHYFGPFDVVLNGAGIEYGDTRTTASLRLRNQTTNTLTVNLQLAPSETAPVGQPAVAGTPPLILRNNFNPTNLVYGYTTLPVGTVRSWTLAPMNTPGSEVEIVIGLNRSAINNNIGELLAGILQFTDGLGISQINVPVTGTPASSAGLWVGSAIVDEVGQYLKAYSRDAANNPLVATNGSYIVTNVDTSIGRVQRPFPLRLIVHNPESGNAALLQRVFVGFNAQTNMILSRGESALAPVFLKDARRLSAVHLPFTSTNMPWYFNGRLVSQTNLATTISQDYNSRASNPFLHSYHPDHDNLDVTFKTLLPQGSESYSIQREISLSATPPTDDFSSVVSANKTINGVYHEIITLKGLARAGGTNDTRTFEVRGNFSLNRVSEISQLTPAP